MIIVIGEWRRKALELFPDLQEELQEDIERGDLTTYGLFSRLLTRCVQAHRDKNTEELKKIYDYAEWCLRQPAKDVWNAAGVSFYEHLSDYKATRKEMYLWVKPDVFAEVAGLLEFMMGEKKSARLKKQYADL
jgi:hypothetical protein